MIDRQHHILRCLAVILSAALVLFCSSSPIDLDISSHDWTAFLDVDADRANLWKVKRIPAHLAGEGGGKVDAIAVSFENGVLNFHKWMRDAGLMTAAVLFTDLRAPRDTTLLVGTSADWWMRWWVNGKPVYSTMADTLCSTGSDGNVMPMDFTSHPFALPLKKGKNLVAAEVLAGSGGWKLLCTTDTTEFIEEYRQSRDRLVRSGGSSERTSRRRLRDRLPQLDIPAESVLSTLHKGHPRIFVRAEDIPGIKAQAEQDHRYGTLIDMVIAQADELARGESDARRGGRGLPGQALTCGLAYHLSGKTSYTDSVIERALAMTRQESLTNKYLNFADEVAGLALVYDWMFSVLTEQQRDTIRTAIVEKGIKRSLQQGETWYKVAPHNWNQVCNAGMIIGALAVADEAPSVCEEVLREALESIRWGLAAYAPSGVCPEGPGYWGYGAGHSVLTMAALESALGTDFGASKAPGFRESALYAMHVIDPTGYYYSYSDCGSGRTGGADTYGWFAAAYDDEIFAWQQQSLLNRMTRSGSGVPRVDPFQVLFHTPAPSECPANLSRDWVGMAGLCDLAAFRSSWDDPGALYVACKAGSPVNNHGHMDIGSFVLTADGVRWALDLGSDSYGLPGYFEVCTGERWNNYRLNSRAHNTLVIDDRLQNPKPVSSFVKHLSTSGRSQVVMDLSPTYEGQAQRVMRGIAMIDRNSVLIQDEVEGPVGDVRWGMVTGAKIRLDGATAFLRSNGKTLRAEVLEPSNARFSIVSTRPPTAEENQNKGTSMLAVKVSPQNAGRIAVLLTPVGSRWGRTGKPDLTTLSAWMGSAPGPRLLARN